LSVHLLESGCEHFAALGSGPKTRRSQQQTELFTRMPETSLTLLDHLRDHDANQAWERLVQLYAPMIRGWLGNRGLQPADIDDLSQEVLQRLSQSLANFQHAGMRGSFRSWLRGITQNTMRDFWRRRQNRILPQAAGQIPGGLDAVVDQNDELMHRWDEEYNHAVVQGALKIVRPHFDETTWEAFCRLTFEGATPQQVASSLSVSVNSVYLARSRVLRRLRVELRGLLD
jgi:RNA polymerase sigma-70 factor (ECF subfamily)